MVNRPSNSGIQDRCTNRDQGVGFGILLDFSLSIEAIGEQSDLIKNTLDLLMQDWNFLGNDIPNEIVISSKISMN